jgi:hypothetical protein
MPFSLLGDGIRVYRYGMGRRDYYALRLPFNGTTLSFLSEPDDVE